MKRSDSELIFASQILASALSLVSVTLTARYVGPEIFGFLSVALILYIAYMSLSDFGACSWAARELASHSISEQDFISVMQAKNRLNLLPILFSPLVFILLPDNFSWIVILSIYPLLWNNYNFVQQFLVTKGLIRESARLVIVDRFFWLLIIPLEMISFDRVLSFIIPILLGLLTHAILGYTYLHRKYTKQDSLKLFDQRTIFRKARHFGLTSVFGVFSNLDGVIVGLTSNMANSGSYILSQRFRNPLTLIFNSFSTRIRPIAATRDVSLIEKAFKDDAVILGLGLLFNSLFAITVLFGYSKLLGENFENVGLIMCLGSLTSIPLGISLIGSSILNGLGFERFVAGLSGIFSAVLLLSVSIFAYLGGSLGAVVWVFIQSVISGVILSRKALREMKRVKRTLSSSN